MQLGLKDGQVLSRRRRFYKGTSSRGNDPGKGHGVRKKKNVSWELQSYRSIKGKLGLRKTEERELNASVFI